MPTAPDYRASERRKIINRAKRLRDSIQLDLNTAEYWNTHVRKPDEEPIDPDPFGELRRLLTALDEMLAADTGTGPIAPIVFTRSH